MDIGDRIAAFRELMDINQKELANKIGINPVVMNRIERGIRPVREYELAAIADVFGVTMDELKGRNPKKNDIPQNLPPLTKRDERQIAADLEDMIYSLNGAAAMGNSEDAEDMELLKSALEQAMRLSKRIAKKKFAPKRNRKEG